MLKRVFFDHPHRVGETYLEHMGVALSFGFTLIMAGLACMAHAFVPCLFETTASRCIKRLHARLIADPRRAQAPGAGAERLRAS